MHTEITRTAPTEGQKQSFASDLAAIYQQLSGFEQMTFSQTPAYFSQIAAYWRFMPEWQRQQFRQWWAVTVPDFFSHRPLGWSVDSSHPASASSANPPAQHLQAGEGASAERAVAQDRDDAANRDQIGAAPDVDVVNPTPKPVSEPAADSRNRTTRQLGKSIIDQHVETMNRYRDMQKIHEIAMGPYRGGW
jgi:hypothetical protein